MNENLVKMLRLALGYLENAFVQVRIKSFSATNESISFQLEEGEKMITFTPQNEVLKEDSITFYNLYDIFDIFEKMFPENENLTVSNLCDELQNKAKFSYGDSEGVLVKWADIKCAFDEIIEEKDLQKVLDTFPEHFEDSLIFV